MVLALRVVASARHAAYCGGLASAYGFDEAAELHFLFALQASHRELAYDGACCRGSRYDHHAGCDDDCHCDRDVDGCHCCDCS